MREGWPSLTALAVAALRGVASTRRAPYSGVSDPIARTLLPAPLSALPLLARAPLAQPVARLTSLGLLDHIALRTGAIDRALTLALDRGVEQVVLLGAGLDTRAWRMAALDRACVFEVDVESTQRLKLARLAARAPRAREVRFVRVDFARGELEARLAASGHDPSRPSVWIWEGVTPYLPREALTATIASIAARSVRSSSLLVTYATPELVVVPSTILPAVRAAFTVLGEPLVGTIPTPELHALLAAHGLSVRSDTGASDWARVHLPDHALWVEITERLAVAERA